MPKLSNLHLQNKLVKTFFELTLGNFLLDSSVDLIKSPRFNDPQTTKDATVTNLAYLSTACKWQGNWNIPCRNFVPSEMRILMSFVSTFLVTGGSVH